MNAKHSLAILVSLLLAAAILLGCDARDVQGQGGQDSGQDSGQGNEPYDSPPFGTLGWHETE